MRWCSVWSLPVVVHTHYPSTWRPKEDGEAEERLRNDRLRLQRDCYNEKLRVGLERDFHQESASHKHEDPSWIPRTYMVEGKNQLLQVTLFSPNELQGPSNKMLKKEILKKKTQQLSTGSTLYINTDMDYEA